MYDTRYAPKLELDRVINHAMEDFRVIGFTGRDTIYGRNAVILKEEENPQDFVWDDDAEDEYVVLGLPERAVRLMRDENYALYILGDEIVMAAPAEAIVCAEPRVFETFWGDVELLALSMDTFIEYDRSEVRVGV